MDGCGAISRQQVLWRLDSGDFPIDACAGHLHVGGTPSFGVGNYRRVTLRVVFRRLNRRGDRTHSPFYPGIERACAGVWSQQLARATPETTGGWCRRLGDAGGLHNLAGDFCAAFGIT
jgi:hypothetical protein